MKNFKLLLLPIAVLMSVGVVGCGNDDTTSGGDTSTNETVDSTTSVPTSVESADSSGDPEYLVALKDVADTLHQLYKDDTVVTQDFRYGAVSVVGADTFNIVWSIKYAGENQDAIKVGATENKYTSFDVDYLGNNDTECKYTLVATITDKDGNSYTQDIVDQTIPVFKINTYEEYTAAGEANSDDIITIKGRIVGRTPFGRNNIYVQDERGYGYYAYAVTLGSDMTADTYVTEFAYGREIIISGTVTVYSGLYEFERGCSYMFTDDDSIEIYNYTNATEKFAAATSNRDTSLIPYQSTKVQIDDCTLTRIDGSYYYFTVGESSVEFNLYKSTSYFLTSAENDTLYSKFIEGKKATIKGIVNCYSNAYQIYPDSVDSIEVTNYTDTEKASMSATRYAAANSNVMLNNSNGTTYTVVAPEENEYDATYTVTMTDSTYASYANNVVTVNGTNSEPATLTFSVTAQVGTASSSVQFTITIQGTYVPTHAGTLADPYSVTDAVNIVASLPNRETATDFTFTKGTIKSITSPYDPTQSYGNATFVITDGESDFICFRCKWLEGASFTDVSQIAVGDEVVVTGRFVNYDGALEYTANCYIVSTTNAAAPKA